MSLVLQPQANFTVVRQIANHLDTDTNYVKAVIRNAYTDDIIDTLQLTDKGSQRFKKDWQVPADPSGQGFYISIVTSVYTDSGYTSKNPNYGDEETTYLVQDRVLHRGGGGYSVSTGVDARTVRRILREELDKLKPEETTDTPDTADTAATPTMIMPEPSRAEEILGAIKALKTALKPTPAKPVDLAPVLAKFEAVMQAIEAKEVTPITDLQPILDRLKEQDDTNELGKDELVAILKQFAEVLSKNIPAEMTKLLKKATFTIPMQASMDIPNEKETEPTPTPFDIKRLAL